ncbi:MAG: hypothetical protein JWN15_1076 [Firmicutes bacterium]|nr:hypothetical protein [Bacillota bacterium]
MRRWPSVFISGILSLALVHPVFAQPQEATSSLADRAAVASAGDRNANTANAPAPDPAMVTVETTPAPTNETEGDSPKQRQKPKASLQAARAYYSSVDFKVSSVPTNEAPATSYVGDSGLNPYLLYANTPADEVFIADHDSFSDLDQYLFADRSPYRFWIPITRYYGEVDANGHLKSPAKLIKNKLLPAKALLALRVYDVDDDYQGTAHQPERDIVYVNGHELDRPLSSGNDTWPTLTYEVPIEWLKFPQPGDLGVLPVPALNEISIEIDKLNGGSLIWGVQADWGAILLPAVRPVALVNGILSGKGAWDQFQPFLDEIGIPSERVAVGGWSSIDTNAQTLLQELPKVEQKFGVSRLNVIAHSKGGLDTRAYIRARQDIDTLVQLGTPNRGSECADVRVGGHFKMTSDLRAVWIFENFNYRKEGSTWVLNTPEAKYSRIFTIAGTKYNDRFCMFYLGVMGARLDPPHDGVVSVDRVTPPWRWAGWDGDGQNQGTVDFTTTTDHSGLHDSLRVAQKAIEWIAQQSNPPLQLSRMASPVAPLVNSSSGLTQSAVAPEKAPAPAPSSLIDTAEGTLASGHTDTLSVTVSGVGSVRFRLNYAEGNPTFEVVTPDGKVLTPATAKALKATYAAGTALLQTKMYEVASPKAGTWILRAIGDGSDAPYQMQAEDAAAPVLTASVNTSAVRAGDSVTVTGLLADERGQPLPGGTLTAFVTDPNGAQQTYSMQETASGVFSVTVSSTADGYYSIRVVAETTTGRRRTTYTEFGAGGNSARLSGTYSASGNDTTGDGMLDELRVNADAVIQSAGSYRLTADLTDLRGNVIDSATSFASVTSAGQTSFALRFDGKRIFASGAEGPYTLHRVALFQNDILMDAAEAPAFETQAYSHTSFQHDTLYLTGTFSDQGVDLNNDKSFDQLRVNLGVHTETSGTYSVTARLLTEKGQAVGWTSGSVDLGTGDSQVNLMFSGQEIQRMGYSGRFMVTDLTIQGDGGALFGRNVYLTRQYQLRQFPSIPTDLYVLPKDITVSPAKAQAGRTAKISVVVQNAGDAGKAFDVEVYLDNPETGGTLIDKTTVKQIARRGKATVSMPWRIVQRKEPYTLYVRVNENRTLTEFDYSNNAALKTVEVLPQTFAAKVAFDTTRVVLGGTDPVTAYIQLPTTVNPAQIVPTSIAVNRQPVPAAGPVEIVDHNRDKVPELAVTFERAAFETAIQHLLTPKAKQGRVQVEVAGELIDGSRWSGTVYMEVHRP